MTIFQVPNFGSVLQAFATQSVLQKMGFDCRLINYRYPNKWHDRKNHGALNIVRKVKEYLKKTLKIFHSQLYDLNRFRKKYLGLTRPYPSLEALCEHDWSDAHAIIAGSDQIWNPRFLLGDPAFMLSFGRGVRKISVASSFACDNLPDDMIDIYRKNLSAFQAISVREAGGRKIIAETLGLDVRTELLLDPTLLISAEDWTRLLGLDELPMAYRKPYVLVYILEYSFSSRPYIYDVARYVAELLNCDTIVSLFDTDRAGLARAGAESVGYSSVENFVNLFRNASAIVTSSFHGTAFAVNFGVPLIAVTPPGRDDRQTSLLNILGLERNALPVGSPLAGINPFYDRDRVETRLNEIRNDNLRWIRDSLE